MRIRTWQWILLVTFVLALAGAWYLRPIRQARLIGLEWPTVVNRSTCRAHGAEVVCASGILRPPPQHGSLTAGMVQLNRWTRGLSFASRAWMISDSVQWWAMTDSLRRSVYAAGGRPLSCDATSAESGPVSAWEFGNYEARLYSGRVPASRRHRAFWSVAIGLVPRGTPGCGRAFRYELPSPSQLAQQMEDWLTGRFGF